MNDDDTTPKTGTGAPPDWAEMAAQLDALSQALFDAAAHVPDEIEAQIVELQAITLRHYGHALRVYAED